MKKFIKTLIISLLCIFAIQAFITIRPKPSLYDYGALLFVLVLFYNLILPFVMNLRKSFIRMKRKYFPSIGVLSGNIKSPIGEYKCQRVWISITPTMWLSHLRKNLSNNLFRKLIMEIRFLHSIEINESYSMIINPFGDNFPEENTKLLTTFYKICEYIKNGGFYVCTGGAFYLHQNPVNSEDYEGVIIKIHDGMQNLRDSLFYKEFGILTTGDGYPNEKEQVTVVQNSEDKKCLGDIISDDVLVKRFRSTIKDSSDYIPLVREKENETYPVVAIKYGNGYLLHFGMLLESVESEEFKIICNVIDKLISKKFKNL